MRTTNMIKRKFQWFIDLQTSADKVTVVDVRAGGQNVYGRLLPFFLAFKYYKLGGVKIRLAPASTLPVDPTGLSLEAGENTVDPRDQFNPGLIRITNGEDFYFPNGEGEMTGDQQMSIYNTMMLDPRWFKFQLQSGCKRYATPRFWNVGQVHQDAYPGSSVNLPYVNVGEFQNSVRSEQSVQVVNTQNIRDVVYTGENTSKYGLFQTGNNVPLGWLPTDYRRDGTAGIDKFVSEYSYQGVGGAAAIPEVELMKIILPKAYKTIYYYRLFIEETVYFRSPVNYNAEMVSGNWQIPMSGDRFIAPNMVQLGGSEMRISSITQNNPNDGGN